MEEVKRNDLLIFKNEVLEDIRNVEKKLNEKLINLSNRFQNSDLIIGQKFEYFKDRFDEILKKVDTTEFQNIINDKIEKFAQKIDDESINNKIKIQNMEKNLADSCYKYDELFLKNMSSPGLIGDGCPYPTMKSFFNHLDKKIKELIKTKDRAFSDFNSLKSYLGKTIESFENHIVKKGDEIYKIISEKVKDNDKSLNDKMKKLEDKFENIRLENSQYVYNIIKNQEIINEKLKFELKKYSVINETLLNFYNKQNKIQKANKNNENNYKTLLNAKSTKRNLKQLSLNMNEILPALQKMEENFNLNSNLYKNNDLKDLKVKVEDSNFEIQKKGTFTKNFLKENKGLLMRRGTVGDLSFNFKLFNPNYKTNLFRENKMKTFLNSNKNNSRTLNINNETIYKTEEKQNDIEDNYNNNFNPVTIKTTKSEKKIFDKKIDENFPSIQNKKSAIFENRNSIKNKLDLSLKNENKNVSQDTIIKPRINNDYLINEIKIINEEKNEEIKSEIKITKEIKNEIKDIKEENTIKEINEEKSISEKENKIKEENGNHKQMNNNNLINKTYKNFSISSIGKENAENKKDEKIEKIYKYIEKKNEETNEKIEIIGKQLNYLIKEIAKILKDKKQIKTNIMKFSNSISDNINLNNLYISNDSIVPIKYSDRTCKIHEKSISLDASESKNFKRNNRVINIIQNNNNNNNYNDNENYCLLLNKIEPYLIKKFTST